MISVGCNDGHFQFLRSLKTSEYFMGINELNNLYFSMILHKYIYWSTHELRIHITYPIVVFICPNTTFIKSKY